eukprot:88564_1
MSDSVFQDCVHRCGACGKSGITARCSGCRFAWYCNVTCQRNHWGWHKPVCKFKRNQLKSLQSNKMKGKITSYKKKECKNHPSLIDFVRTYEFDGGVYRIDLEPHAYCNDKDYHNISIYPNNEYSWSYTYIMKFVGHIIKNNVGIGMDILNMIKQMA